MKIGNFVIKAVSVAVIVGVLLYYQSIAGVRVEAAAENEAQIAEIEAHNKEVKRRMEEEERKAKGAAETEEAQGPYQNGSYNGEAMGYGGIIKLTVHVEGGYIENIDVTDHAAEDPAYYFLAETVVDQIVQAQGTDTVDTVSGATLSSTGLIQAVDAALKKAVK